MNNKNKMVSALVTLELKVIPHSCTLEQFVKVLHRNEVYINILQLVMWLHYEDYINIDERAPRDKFNPITKKSEEEKLLEEKISIPRKSDGTTVEHSTLMITCKGQCYFLNKLISRGIGRM